MSLCYSCKAFKNQKEEAEVKITSLLTLMRKQWNLDLAKDISHWRQHLRLLCNWYKLCLKNRLSFHFINQRFIVFYKFCVLVSLHQKNTPEDIFFFILKQKFPLVKHTFWVCFCRVFNILCWNLEKMLPDNQAKRGWQGIFIVCSFQKLWLLFLSYFFVKKYLLVGA